MSATSRLSSLSSQLRQASTMKEAIMHKGAKVEIIDSPIPRAGPGQVVTKVIFSGSNPKDWKIPELVPDVNQGDDIAGFVVEVGEGVSEFKPGDRVAAFHEMTKPGGSYAEYALSWAYTTFPLAPHVSFEEGAAVPLAAMTACIGLYARLALPPPFLPASDDQKIPLVIYGASSAVGSYCIQLARRSNIHPLICVAGRASAHVEKLIDRSQGDTVLDYRKGNEALVLEMKQALQGAKLEYAFDAVSERDSYGNICKVLEPDGKITFVISRTNYGKYVPAGIRWNVTRVGDVHGFPDHLEDFGYVYFRYIARGLQEGWFQAQPHEIIPGGLAGVEKALMQLKDGTVSAKKYIFRIADTPGVTSP